MSKYFTEAETQGLSRLLVEMLDIARSSAGVPFVITSGYRDPSQNTEAGGVEGSAHTSGLAVDLRVENSNTRFRILSGLFFAGFNRIGVYNGHIHVDIDQTKPQNVVWTGVSH